MRKFSAIGVLIGIGIGFILQFFFPQILEKELIFNILFRQQINLPINNLLVSGSIFNVGNLLPTILGFIGGLGGALLF